jgi:hypothetical protein
MRGATHPLPQYAFVAWRSVYKKYRDDFTLPFCSCAWIILSKFDGVANILVSYYANALSLIYIHPRMLGTGITTFHSVLTKLLQMPRN